MNDKAKETEFLNMIVQGNIDEAFNRFVDLNGKHHNINFPADFNELKNAMKITHERYPDKKFEIIHSIAENDKIAIMSKMTNNKTIYATTYFFKFETGKITEMWDFIQEIPKNILNKNGAF